MFSRITFLILACFLSVGWSWDGGWDAGDIPGSAIKLNVDNFNGNLSSSDTDVQTAFETFDSFTVPPGYTDQEAQTATGWTKSGTNVFLTTSTDSVGIGTLSPQSKLDVEGNVYFGAGNVGIGTSNTLSILDIQSGINPVITIGGVNTTASNGTGGTITEYTSGGVTYTVHKFTNVGVGTFIAPTPAATLDVLVVAGGGGGGGWYGGGGGAGGIYGKALQQYSATAGQSISVNVGNGGLYNNNGQDSSFGTFTAIGGGYGGNSADGSGAVGGSGGGGMRNSGGSAGTSGQGMAGGNSDPDCGSGGGGASANGGNGWGGYGGIGGDGGNGLSFDITGTPTYYAGGGGGACQSGGTGGLGGGGTMNNGGALSATPNTGGGGGARADLGGGRGGSGIVIIRYVKPDTNTTQKLQFQGNHVNKWDVSASDSTSKLTVGNGSTRLSIDSIGQVGIGTTAQRAMLDVEGSVYLKGNVGIATTTPVNKLDVYGGAVIGTTYAGAMIAPTNGVLVVGNVGLGTVNPMSTLDVNGSLRLNVTETAVNLSLNATHHTIMVTGTTTITLPTAVGITGRQYNVINSGIGTVTIATTGGQTIRGEASLEMYDQGSVVVISNGANWERGS